MTQEEVNALVSWIGEQRPRGAVCVFAHMDNSAEKDGPLYECEHGKRLTREKARRGLGLPV